jgi:hypothetical protein
MVMVMPHRISYARRILAVITLCCDADVVYLGVPSMRFREKLGRHLLPVMWTSWSVILFVKTRNLADFVVTILS